MKWFWRILFLVSVTVAVWFGLSQKERRDQRYEDIDKLSVLLNPKDFAMLSETSEVEQTFGQALVLMNKYSKEAITKDYKDREITGMRPLVTQAVDKMSCTSEERELVLESITKAHADLDDVGAFDDPTNVEAIAEGRWPIAVKGPFAGQQMKIGWLVSPLIAPKLINHFGNFVFLPECVWNMQEDRLSNQSISIARRFRSCSYLTSDDWAKVDKAWSEQSKR